MRLGSSAFQDGGEIPRLYTCQGRDLSPPLEWWDIPPQTQTLALIVDDPDAPDPAAPRMTFVHLVLYNVSPRVSRLPEGLGALGLPPGALFGANDWQRAGYGGPCPPVGRRRYFHKLYALDAVLPDLGTPTKARLLGALEGHVLAQAQLVGTYEKKL